MSPQKAKKEKEPKDKESGLPPKKLNKRMKKQLNEEQLHYSVSSDKDGKNSEGLILRKADINLASGSNMGLSWKGSAIQQYNDENSTNQ